MTREEAIKLLQVTRLMLMDGANQPISDLYYALGMAIEALEQTENSSEKPNNCEDLQDWKDRMWAEAIVTEPTISKMEQVEDETRLTAKCLNCANGSSYKCSKCDGEMYYKYDKDEPQTDCAWR